MHDIVNIPAVQILIGTLPIIALLALTLLDQKKQFADIRSDIGKLRDKIDAMDIRLSSKIDDLAQRVAKIEGKIEGHHVVLEG